MNFQGIKASIYIDHDNLVHGQDRNGLRYDKIVSFVEKLGIQIIRATTYMAVDYEAEGKNEELRTKNQDYRNKIRQTGFRVFEKKLMRYENDNGVISVKGNTDLDLAVDALSQSTGSEFVLLGTGDGDFVPLVRALQDKGKRVEGFAFRNYAGSLVRSLDGFHLGHQVCTFGHAKKEQLVTPVTCNNVVTNIQDSVKAVQEKATKREQCKQKTIQGKIANFNIDEGWGFISPLFELDKAVNQRKNIFFHINDVRDSYYQSPSNLEVHEYMLSSAVLEYVEGTNQRGAAAQNIRFLEEN